MIRIHQHNLNATTRIILRAIANYSLSHSHRLLATNTSRDVKHLRLPSTGPPHYGTLSDIQVRYLRRYLQHTCICTELSFELTLDHCRTDFTTTYAYTQGFSHGGCEPGNSSTFFICGPHVWDRAYLGHLTSRPLLTARVQP